MSENMNVTVNGANDVVDEREMYNFSRTIGLTEQLDDLDENQKKLVIEAKKRNKYMFMGIGAAGNKAIDTLIREGTILPSEAVMVNSTSKDFSNEYKCFEILINRANMGCGKERDASRRYAEKSLENGFFDDIFINVNNVIMVTSTEGGTGSGATPTIADYVTNVLGKNVHIIAFTGFEEDVRGINNTVQFFKEFEFECDIQTIKNKLFMNEAKNNKYRAEELANLELNRRVRIMIGADLMVSGQNMDDTDLFKVIGAHGYKSIEYVELDDEDLVDREASNKKIKRAIQMSKSMKPGEPKSIARLGVILNISKENEGVIDSTFPELVEAYGIAYELFTHKQYNGGKQYIAFIPSGMNLPKEELKKLYNKYLDISKQVNKSSDSYYEDSRAMVTLDEDAMFDLVSNKATMNKGDFFKKRSAHAAVKYNN